MEFWTINPQGDSNTKNMSDLRQSTWDELKMICAVEKLADGSKMGAGYVLNKYLEYSVYIDDINKTREDKYKKAKASIYSFLNKKMFNENYKPEIDSRAHYLYGGNMKLSIQLKEIFIAEIIKNRDGGNNEDHNIIRYNANLDYNIFKPLI